LFENVANSSLSCDVKDMICDDTGHCQNDCLNHAGQVRRKRIQCTLPEFVAYMLDSGTRVQKALNRLDVAARHAMPHVTRLHRLVNRTVIRPIQTAVDGARCGFLQSSYKKTVDGLCHKGVTGIIRIGESQLVCASSLVVFIIVMYVVWRRTIDNYNSWTLDEKALKQAAGKLPAAALGFAKVSVKVLP